MKPIVAVLYLSCYVSYAAADTSEKIPNKMATVLAGTQLSKACQNKVTEIAKVIIGKKRHRILDKQVSDSDRFHTFVLLSYNDQDSHLSITAKPAKEGCQVDTTESFELPAPCTEARQSIFKRWAMLGRLNEETIVMRYDNPRNKKELQADENIRAMGYLTQTRRGASCLITRQQQNVPLPLSKED